MLIARTLMNPLGLEKNAMMHSVDRHDWPKGCVVDTNVGKVYWNRTKGVGGHSDGGQSVPCAARSGEGEIRLAQAGTECAIPEQKSKTHRVAKTRCYEIGRPIANERYQEHIHLTLDIWILGKLSKRSPDIVKPVFISSVLAKQCHRSLQNMSMF